MRLIDGDALFLELNNMVRRNTGEYKYGIVAARTATMEMPTIGGEINVKENHRGREKMLRNDVLEQAEKMVNGDRQDDYGTPEQNFERIAMLWTCYLGEDRLKRKISPVDVAAMMALLKIARIASGHGKSDNWIDLAGYAACGGELQSIDGGEEEKNDR